jgi:hypothetical protein
MSLTAGEGGIGNWRQYQACLSWWLREAGWFMGEWQLLLAALFGLLSRRTFLTQGSPAWAWSHSAECHVAGWQ